MVNVKIDPAFGDDHMEGEYDEARFQQADEALQQAVVGFIHAGARADNLEETIANALTDRVELG